MIDYPDAAWTKQQLTERLALTTRLLQSEDFEPAAPFTSQSQTQWIHVICAISDLVRQASLAGKRIDFTQDVNIDDEGQDITSLLDSMRRSAYIVRSSMPSQLNLTILSPNLNHFYGAGAGHFSNGLLFACEYDNEMAFFIGRDRVFFYRHLMRAFMEARYYLLSLN
ncbi:hypothetical protein [Spirosoma sp. KNUC1025]|uniref:hypothetical protein n=1 Tax=Spirosoma sp. KNUC1025 TaxID=2894082 RepID=UPI00386BC39B|nr:hypothetical protein LN737_01530 [Spirosoma sp. KNUC1025]